jgi:excisionase family DNA binding protein
MLNNQILTTKEAAKYLKINRQVLEKYLRKGQIPARKIGRQWRLSKLALDLWLSPSLAALLPSIQGWKQIFSLGDKIKTEKPLTNEKILKEVEKLRKKSGSSPKSSS